ncbi:DEAD/DEAH box helicase family protein [Klebsiella pneumoniae]
MPHVKDNEGKAVAGRLYQLETIARVSERFTNKYRQSLIVQATGTGKTRVAIALRKVRISTLRNENETFSQLNSITYIGVFLRLVTYSHLP